MKATTLYKLVLTVALLALIAGCGSSGSGGMDYVLPMADDGTNDSLPVDDGNISNAPTDTQAPVVEAKQWSLAEIVDAGAGDSGWDQKVASDSNGNAIIVWLESINGTHAVMANRFNAGSGWEGVVRVDGAGMGDASALTIAMNNDGYAAAAWHKISGSTTATYARVFIPSSGWGGEVLLGSGGLNPSVSIDANGNAIFVWRNRNGATYDIMSMRYSPEYGWLNAVTLDVDEGNASSASITYLSNGDAIAVWQQYIDWTNNVLAASYDGETGTWAAPVYLERSYGSATYPTVVADKYGSGAMATWNQDIGTKDTVLASRYDPATGWSMAVDLAEGDDADSYDAEIDFDRNGNAVAVWYNYDRTRGDSIMSAYYDATTGWGEAVTLQSGGDLEYLDLPKVKFSSVGVALAVWSRYDGYNMVLMYSWFNADGGWSALEQMATPSCDTCGNPDGVFDPQLMADGLGNITLSWSAMCYNCGCDSKIYAMRYE